jgi:hypothetical protein
MALAARCGLGMLLTEWVRIAAWGGANATTKILALIAGMVAGADSISDMGLLLWVPETRSTAMPIFVEETAEPVESADATGVGLGDVPGGRVGSGLLIGGFIAEVEALCR